MCQGHMYDIYTTLFFSQAKPVYAEGGQKLKSLYSTLPLAFGMNAGRKTGETPEKKALTIKETTWYKRLVKGMTDSNVAGIYDTG